MRRILLVPVLMWALLAWGSTQQFDLNKLRQAVQRNPQDVRARIALGNALDDSGDSEGAIAQYREALRLDPSDPFAYHNLGVTHLRRKEWPAAYAALTEAVRLKPDYTNARLKLAGIAVLDGKDSQALEHCTVLARTARRETGEFLGLEIIHGAMAEFGRAREESAAHVCFGLHLLRERGAAADAEKEFLNSARLDPSFALPYRLLVQAYGKQGKNEDANASMRRATQMNPDLGLIGPAEKAQMLRFLEIHRAEQNQQRAADWKKHLAFLLDYLHQLEKLNDPRAAQEIAELESRVAEKAADLEKLLKQLAPDAEGHLLLSKTYMRMGDPKAAVVHALTAVAAAPSRADAHFQLATAREKAGDLPGARAALQKAVALQPDSAEYREALRRLGDQPKQHDGTPRPFRQF